MEETGGGERDFEGTEGYKGLESVLVAAGGTMKKVVGEGT